jgi:hypothetical protein
MEKHKSKYKKPETNKSTPRKDLKDYTMDDKSNGLNPFTTGDKQLNVLRKTDKEIQDDGKMYPTYNADDRLYKDLEDADYDPKTAAKRLKKRQDDEEKNTSAVLKDKIENLTRESKELLVREYIRRKISRILSEQDAAAPEEEPAAPEAPAPTDAPAPEAPAPEAPAPTEAPAPPEAPTTEPPAPAEDKKLDSEAPAEDKKLDPEAIDVLAITRFSKHMSEQTGNIARIKTLAKVLNSTFKEAEPEDKNNFYNMLKTFSLKKLAELDTANKSKPEQ